MRTIVPFGSEQLRERRAAGRVWIDEALLLVRARRRLERLGVKGLVDGREQRAADAHVDEQPHAGEHDRHRQGEAERQPDADRQPAHSAPVSASR